MKKVLATLVVAAFGVTATYAQVEAWDVTGHGSPADATLGASTIDSNLSTTSGLNSLSRTTVVAANLANSFNSNTWNITNTFDQATNYFSFTLQAASGFQVSLTSLQYAINGTNTAPVNGLWGYSIGGGAFVFQPQFSLANATPSGLATWDFDDFSTTQSVEFRFWAYGATAITGGTSSTTGAVRIANISGNDLVLNGSVVSAVPEPATFGLIGFGLLGTWAFAYRRGRKSS